MDKFNNFDRSYATIVDISMSEKSITLNKSLNGEYYIAVTPLLAGYLIYISPTRFAKDNASPSIAYTLTEQDGDSKIIGYSARNDDIYKFDVTDDSLYSIVTNIFVIQSYTNLLFLMISQINCSTQEKIEIVKTEFEYLYNKIMEQLNLNEKKLSDFIIDNFFYWLYFGNCTNRFGQEAITIFNAIPDPPGNFYNWDDVKKIYLVTIMILLFQLLHLP